MWFWLALGSAVFAALTSILAKIGIEGRRIVSGYSDPHDGRCRINGMGNGPFHYSPAGGLKHNQPEKLAVSDSVPGLAYKERHGCAITKLFRWVRLRGSYRLTS